MEICLLGILDCNTKLSCNQNTDTVHLYCKYYNVSRHRCLLNSSICRRSDLLHSFQGVLLQSLGLEDGVWLLKTPAMEEIFVGIWPSFLLMQHCERCLVASEGCVEQLLVRGNLDCCNRGNCNQQVSNDQNPTNRLVFLEFCD